MNPADQCAPLQVLLPILTNASLANERHRKSHPPLVGHATRKRRMFALRTTAVLLAGVLATGCMVFDVKEQQAKLDAVCTLNGTASATRAQAQSIVVVLLRRRTAVVSETADWQIVDHFILEQPGAWVFVTGAGEYRVIAFADANRDAVIQPGEAMVITVSDRIFSCAAGARFDNIALAIPASSPPLDFPVDVAALQARSAAAQVTKTLSQLTAVGEIISMQDERLSRANSADSLWRPFDAMIALHPGVYLLEPHDPRKTPVLFVHGVNDSPARFSPLIARLDRKRFQPWLYSYPSGVGLSDIADHLNQTMAKLRLRHRVPRFAVVAHSSGGLVARGYLLRHAADKRAGNTPLFVTISTPWDGHKMAELGVKYAPTVVRVWYDLAPGSEYLRSLFERPLPADISHHLLFSYRRDSSTYGESADQTVTVASQLSTMAQRESARIYGFDDTHTGVVSNAEMSALLNDLLEKHY